MSDFYKKIIEGNKNWVATKISEDPEYFEKLSKGQSPPLLWIGCSDSRVPANEIIGASFCSSKYCKYGGTFGYEYA